MAAEKRKLYSSEELAFRENLSSRLASIDGKIDNLHEKLTPILALQQTVTDHDRQIHRWMGINAVLSGLAGIIISVAASWYAKFRHWW